MVDFKGSHFEREIVLWGVRWYVAYPISDRQLEEMMEERGVKGFWCKRAERGHVCRIRCATVRLRGSRSKFRAQFRPELRDAVHQTVPYGCDA